MGHRIYCVMVSRFHCFAELHYHQTNLKGHICVLGDQSTVTGVQSPSPETRYVFIKDLLTFVLYKILAASDDLANSPKRVFRI